MFLFLLAPTFESSVYYFIFFIVYELHQYTAKNTHNKNSSVTDQVQAVPFTLVQRGYVCPFHKFWYITIISNFVKQNYQGVSQVLPNYSWFEKLMSCYVLLNKLYADYNVKQIHICRLNSFFSK